MTSAGAAAACRARQNWRAKSRYRQADAACQFADLPPDRFLLRFPEPQWAVTPGQSAVIYDGEVCLGGGVIVGAEP